MLAIATGTSCRLRSGNCPDADGATKDNEPPSPSPRNGLHGDASSTAQPAATSKRRKCCPYDFDSSLCQMVNDRILCGFNRNRGRLANNQEYRELADGCRLRGGRVECGYVQAPYMNPRRPPPHYAADPAPDPNGVDDDRDYPVEANMENVRLIGSRTPDPPTQTGQPHEHSETTPIKPKRMSTRCVEISDRIVCRHIMK